MILDQRLPQLFFAAALSVGAISQIRIPVGPTGIALTGSDAVAAAACVFLCVTACRGWRPDFKLIVPRLPVWFAVATAGLLCGLAVGIANAGLHPWAATRVVGWIVILAHVLVVAWVASDPAARRLLIRILIVGLAMSVLVDFVQLYRGSNFAFQPNCNGWFPEASGLMQNPNAFGFALLIGLAVLLGESEKGLFASRRIDFALMSIVVFNMALTSSRSAWVSALAVAAVALALGWASRIRVPLAIVLGAAAACLFLASAACQSESAAVVRDVLGNVGIPQSQLAVAPPEIFEGSNNERFYGYRRALELFSAHPIVGAGLGSFLASELASSRPALIIHSTSLWLLAETGLVGFLSFLALGASIVLALWSQLRAGTATARRAALTGLLVILAFAVMSQAQELLYQRIFWIVMTLSIVRRTQCAPQSEGIITPTKRAAPALPGS